MKNKPSTTPVAPTREDAEEAQGEPDAAPELTADDWVAVAYENGWYIQVRIE